MDDKNCKKPSIFENSPYQYQSVDGLRIAYRDCGDGPVIVMLHGWPVNGSTFARIVDALSARYRCVVPDLPGAGETRWSTGHNLSPAGQARLIKGLLHNLNIDEYSLLGNDSGGIIARYLASLDKPAVKKLVLLNTEIPGHRAPYQRAYKVLAQWLPGYNAIAAIQLKFPAYLRSKRGFGGTLYNQTHLLGSFNHRFIAPLTRSRLRMNEARLSFIAVLDWDQLDQLREVHPHICADTLMIWGRQDDTFPEALGFEMSRDFKNLRGFVSIDNAKLYVHEDQPEQVIRHLDQFMSC